MTTTAQPVKTDKMEMSDTDEDIDIIASKSKNNTTQNTSSTAVTKPASKAGTADTNKMWIEKYRPTDLRGVISHEDIVSTINELVTSRKLPHLLFYGPPGTGKTTTILACARELNGKHWKSMTLELNASDERGIDIIRDRVKTFASTKQVFNNGFKLIILDEADAMTSAAQFALRRVIEKFTKNTRFCLICNYVNKIIPALQSRCTKFRFAPLKDDDIQHRMYDICKQEQIPSEAVQADGVKAILKLSEGDMRKCINILQSTWTSFKLVDEHNVHECTGSPKDADILAVADCLLNQDFKPAFSMIFEVMLEKGLALNDIIHGLYQLVIKMRLDALILCQVLSELADLEHRLTVATNEKIQLASLVAIFQRVRYNAFKAHKQKLSPQK